MPRIALLLSGCGNMDGSEIHESVSAIIAIDQKNWEIVFTAPDTKQTRTVSHFTGKDVSERDALQESARIARGRIEPLNEDLLSSIDAIVIPGGLGAATTLCDFATMGSSCKAHPTVENFLKNAHRKGIPIAAMCIAPALIARIFPGASVTIGTDPDTAAKIQAMGCNHVDCSAEQVHVDHVNKIVTTPAYMAASGPAQVFQGALNMIEALEELIPS